MYVCIFIMSIIRKKRNKCNILEIKQKYKKTVVKKQQPKPCIASQVNQTTDRDEKAHDAIALQLVKAPSLS